MKRCRGGITKCLSSEIAFTAPKRTPRALAPRATADASMSTAWALKALARLVFWAVLATSATDKDSAFALVKFEAVAGVFTLVHTPVLQTGFHFVLQGGDDGNLVGHNCVVPTGLRAFC